MFRIEIDKQLCSGFGACVEVAPALFELDRSGIVSLLVSETDDGAALEASRSCPMSAIAVFDTANREQVS
jgi:ferredoxin